MGKKSSNAGPSVFFIEALRNVGYTNYSAIADIVDNSIDLDVKASIVDIVIKENKNGIGYESIKIIDNGLGMTKSVIEEAVKFGSNTGKTRRDSLGSYGAGLKTASLSMAQRFLIKTKTKTGTLIIKDWDSEFMRRNKDWDLPEFEVENSDYNEFYEEREGNSGTTIEILNPDRITNKSLTSFTEHLSYELGLAFKNYINNGLVIRINGEAVESLDPMLRDSEFVKQLTSTKKQKTLTYNGQTYKYDVFKIEDYNGDDNRAEANRVYGKLKKNKANAGFYIYRNGRLVGSGLDLGIVGKGGGDGYANPIRIELLMDGNSDEIFGSTFMKVIHDKNKKDFDSDFIKVLDNEVKAWILQIKNDEKQKNDAVGISERVKRRFEASVRDINLASHLRNANGADSIRIEFVQASSFGRIFTTEMVEGSIVFSLNQNHKFVNEFLAKQSKKTISNVMKLFTAFSLCMVREDFNDMDMKLDILNTYLENVSEEVRRLM